MADPIPPPTPPPLFSGAETVLDEPAGTTTTTGLPPNVAAGLACLLTIISGIIFLLLEKKNRFVRLWAMQAVIFGAIWFGSDLVLTLMNAVFSHVPVLHVLVDILVGLLRVLLYIAGLIVLIVMLVKSFSGQSWEMPFIGKLAREQLAKLNV